MSVELIDFLATDGAVLNGYINKCNVDTDKILIQIHGMTSDCFKPRDRYISSKFSEIGIDTLCFNNRGSEIVRSIKYQDDTKKLGGSAFEDVEDSYYDIVGAINYVLANGYSSIYLQGHSLGATKTVYAYNKMRLNNDPQLIHINGVFLLSLLDIASLVDKYLNDNIKEYIFRKEKVGKLAELLPTENFMKFLSINTLLRYIKYNDNINFARYNDKDYNFKELNNINVPLFMRWGNKNEMIEQDVEILTSFLKEKISVLNQDIGYIDGADHSYNGKEAELAEQMVSFYLQIDSEK